MTNYSISVNPQFNSIEISFNEKPSEQVREALKALRFRWHGVKRVWYGYSTEDEAREAIEGKATQDKTGKPAQKAEKAPAAPQARTNAEGAKTMKEENTMTQVLDRYNYNGERIEVTKLNPGEYLVTFGLNPDGTEHDPKCVGPFLYHEDAISAVYERRPGVKRCNRMCNNCIKNCVGETRAFYSGCVFKKTR